MRLEDAEPFIRSRHPGVNVSLKNSLFARKEQHMRFLRGTASESLRGEFDCGSYAALRSAGCRRHATLARRTNSINFEVRQI